MPRTYRAGSPVTSRACSVALSPKAATLEGVAPNANVVLVWRDTLLPPSETFILNQTEALASWTPVLAGRRTVAGLPLPGHLGPFCLADRQLDFLTFRAVGTSPRLHRLLRRPSTAIVHAHFGPDALTIARAAELARRPLVVTFHGYDAAVWAHASPALARRVFLAASRIIAVSHFVRGELIAAGAPPEKTIVKHIGQRPDLTGPVWAPQRERSIVFVGRLVPKKGADDLLNAVSRLPSELSGTPILLIGDGPERLAMERLASSLRLNATFLGVQPPEQVRHAMRSAGVLCVPSRTAPDGDSEGLGMVFLEAAAQGTPVVSTQHGGIPEAVTDGVTGLLAPERDIDAIAARLATVLQEPEYGERLARAAHERLLASFDLARCTANLEALYDEVVAENHG